MVLMCALWMVAHLCSAMGINHIVPILEKIANEGTHADPFTVHISGELCIYAEVHYLFRLLE